MKFIRLYSFLILYITTILLPDTAMGQIIPTPPAHQYNKTILDVNLAMPQQFSSIPTAREIYWRTVIPESMRKSYIQYGMRYKSKPWETIPRQVFAEYKINGNRSHYEKLYFEKRKQMGNLVMAEIMEHREQFIPDIINGLNYFISDPWWGLPAHYPTNYPDKNNQVVDVFNAETANLLAWTIYMLNDELEEKENGICEKTRNEISRRFLIPSRTNKQHWKNSTSNWNTWICEDWLSCVLICESNRSNQLEAISQILQSLDAFLASYPNDGGCDEGISYWDRAGGSLIEALCLLNMATHNAYSLDNNEKLKAIGNYIYKLHIGNNKFANFADASHSAGILPNICFPVGKLLNDSILMRYAKHIANQYMFEQQAGKLYNASGNYPFLSRELLFLTYYRSFQDIQDAEPLIRDTWLSDLQLFTARSLENSKNGLYVAAKGGHNNELHNHNDLGNFIIYKDAEPLIIDIGAGTYTAQTFNEDRYKLFNCRSAYHNVPLINGIEQHEGQQYRAKNIKYTNNKKQAVMSLDIAEAYPQEACIDRWQRTIQLIRGKKITITEDYKLSKFRSPTVITLICCGEVKLIGNGMIMINNGKNQGLLLFDNNQLTPHVEIIHHQDPVILNSWQNRTLFRISLTIRSHAFEGKIQYSIE